METREGQRPHAIAQRWDPDAFKFAEPKRAASADESADHAWLAKLQTEIAQFDLTTHVAELELKGYTVIPPERAAPAGFMERLRHGITELAARRLGAAPDLAHGSNLSGANGRGSTFNFALLEGPIFEEALMNPVVLAMATSLLGYSCNLWLSAAALKPADDVALTIHADNPPWQPDPWPAYAQVCNVTYAVSDYTVEGGCICFVPGSHRLGRRPTPAEARDYRNPALEPATAAAGSLIVFHGNTWHGAFPRKNPGTRMSLILAFNRMYIEAQEDYRDAVTDDMLARNAERFATLMRMRDPAPYRQEGFHRRFTTMATAGRSLHA